jgi:hypothetical protein
MRSHAFCLGAIGLVLVLVPDLAGAASNLPTPTTYAQTCSLDGHCPNVPPGSVPAAIRRPLHLPKVAGGACPVSPHARDATVGFAGTVVGRGPFRPLVAPAGYRPFADHSILFAPSPVAGWRSVKTLWFANPTYHGPILIRGRRLDAGGTLAFGAATPRITDPQLPPARGNRSYTGATWVTSPGCYAWQVDGTSFSTVIVFRARFGSGT